MPANTPHMEHREIHSEAIGNLEVDPLFTDEAKRVFTLRPGSPAIGRGLRIPGVAAHGPAPAIRAFGVGLERRSSARPRSAVLL